ncbi:hypothetical protein [Andreprevotia lacus]|nr:hypothetical protein [Andreprevotia lacus]
MRTQQGAATLTTSVMLLFVLSLGMFASNHSAFLEQQTNNNITYNSQAKMAADAGLQTFIANFKVNAASNTFNNLAWMDQANNYGVKSSYNASVTAGSVTDIDPTLVGVPATFPAGAMSNSCALSGSGTSKTPAICGTISGQSYMVGTAQITGPTLSSGKWSSKIRIVSIGRADNGAETAYSIADISYDVTPGGGGSGSGSFFAINGNLRYYDSSVNIDITQLAQNDIAAYDPAFSADQSKGISVGDTISKGDVQSWWPFKMNWTQVTAQQAATGTNAGYRYGYTPVGGTYTNSGPASVAGTKTQDAFFSTYFGQGKSSYVSSTFSGGGNPRVSSDGNTVIISGGTYSASDFAALTNTYSNKSLIVDGNLQITGGTSDSSRLADTFIYVSGNFTLGNTDGTGGPTIATAGVFAVEGNMEIYGTLNVNPSVNAYKIRHANNGSATPTISTPAITGIRDYLNAVLTN